MGAVEVELPLCLINHRTMKIYVGGVEKMSGRIHSLAFLTMG
jgi:hypothetical protein